MPPANGRTADDGLRPVVADTLYTAKIGRELAIKQILPGRPMHAAPPLFDRLAANASQSQLTLRPDKDAATAEARLRHRSARAEAKQATVMSIPRLRDYQGPALFSYGFRPFFFFGSVYAGAIILVWLPVFYGQLQLGTVFAPRDWHVHEMLFGYIAAVVAGFLLTAAPNWTGRLPLQGRPLVLLFATWVAGRVAVSVSAWIGWGPAAIIDASFLILLAAAAAREVIAGRKWGNLKIVFIVSLLAAGNVAFHLEAHFAGLAEYATRGGIAMVIVLIALIGGRIISSFTRNWLARQAPGLRGAGSRSCRRAAGGGRHRLGRGISRVCRRLFGGVLVAAPVLSAA
jgi:hypothetical protein